MKKNLKKLLTIAAANTLLSASALTSHADWKQAILLRLMDMW